MNLYANNLSFFDFTDFTDPISPYHQRTSSSLIFLHEDEEEDEDDDGSRGRAATASRRSPPRHRHDGTSPLPFGMDWSTPPRRWDGRDTVWPLDPHTGWSYCVTVPSWILLPNSRGSDPVAFYRVQVGIQSPEGITTTREILRRFSDFLQLLSELKKAFPKKELPQPPPRRILRLKSRTVLEERRSSLEVWMETLLSDIDISRSAPVGTFLELEAAARSSFYDQQESDAHSCISGVGPSLLLQNNSDVSVVADSSAVSSDHGNDYPYEISKVGKPSHDELEYLRLDGHVRRPSTESVGSDRSSIRASEISNFGVSDLFSSLDHPEGGEPSKAVDTLISSDSLFPRNSLVALPSDQRLKLNRVLNTMQQRLATAKTDMEDLLTRLNQEVAVRQFLTTKVKDLEVELETTRESCKENVQQAALNEKERVTQMQWDTEELRKLCLEKELKLKYEQDERARVESAKISIIQENETLLQELDAAREQLENLYKQHEELEVKSKADVKLLVKEVKSLRSSQSELKQELSRLMKEKLEVEAQLLAQDMEKSMIGLDETCNTNGSDRRSDDELRQMLTDIFVDNARLRMQVNTVIRCVLNTYVKSDDDDDDGDEEGETPLRKTVLSRFLER